MNVSSPPRNENKIGNVKRGRNNWLVKVCAADIRWRLSGGKKNQQKCEHHFTVKWRQQKTNNIVTRTRRGLKVWGGGGEVEEIQYSFNYLTESLRQVWKWIYKKDVN